MPRVVFSKCARGPTPARLRASRDGLRPCRLRVDPCAEAARRLYMSSLRNDNHLMTQPMRLPPSGELQELFGAIDIYLFDQLMKGTFDERPRVLDVGCGGGRNLPYFLKHGFEVFAIDSDPGAVSATRSVVARLASAHTPDHVQLGDIDALPWPDSQMDAVV
jgi:SAM-dependent methyltransferase